jgi:hypothetical protein
MDHDSFQLSPDLNLPAFNDSRGLQWWVLVLPFLAIVFLFGCYTLVNGDIWWHLKTGELILAKLRIPTENTFTYTNPKSVWIDLHWGFQFVVALIYTQFGAYGLIFTKSFLGFLTFLLLLLTSRNSLPGWLTLLCWAPFLVIFSARYHVRPEMFSLLFIASTLWILHHASNRHSLLWLLVPIQIAWVNVQGLFVLQHLLVGAFLLQQLVTFIHGRRNTLLLRRLLLIFVLSTMASFINPYGLQGALFPLELMAKMSGNLRVFYQGLAGEMLGISEFIERNGLLAITNNSSILALFGTATVVVISQCASTILLRKLDIYHWLLITGFAYLAWQMNRNSNLYAVVYGYILCSNVANILQFYRLSNKCANHERLGSSASPHSLPQYLLPSIRLAAFFIVVGVLTVTIGDALNHREQTPGQRPQRNYFTEQHPWYNHDAAQFIADIPATLNVYVRHQGTGFAGIVIYHGFDEHGKYSKRVYADARLETNSVAVLRAFQTIPKLLESNMPAAEALLIDEHGELPLLVFGNSELIRRPRLLKSLINSKQWQCIYVSKYTDQSQTIGVSMFMTADSRNSIGLPRVSVEPLLDSLAMFQQ